MKALENHAEEVAAQAAEARLNELQGVLAEQFGQAAVERRGGEIEIIGEGLLRRWLEDASVRFLAAARK